jgi:hypothetical protein
VEPTHEALAVEPQSTVKPAPAASGARAGALQRSIGNRGVVALRRETDPRLTYTKADKSATTFTDEVRCGANSVPADSSTTGHEVAVGTQLLRSGDANFWTLFETADGRWKASYIFIRPNF